jgi:hypothetical protein
MWGCAAPRTGGARPIAEATARISRLEGMEGHGRTAEIRLRKFFPGERFELDLPAAPGGGEAGARTGV